jgi:hypothetical protein
MFLAKSIKYGKHQNNSSPHRQVSAVKVLSNLKVIIKSGNIIEAQNVLTCSMKPVASVLPNNEVAGWMLRKTKRKNNRDGEKLLEDVDPTGVHFHPTFNATARNGASFSGVGLAAVGQQP